MLIRYGDAAVHIHELDFVTFPWLNSRVNLLVLSNTYVSLYVHLKLRSSVQNRIKIAHGYSVSFA